MTFMSKFLVQGRDAGRVLNRISANEVDGKCGKITYTQWLSERGTFEADLTVIKFTDDEFMVVASDTMHRHVETWLKRHIDDEAHATVTDVTERYGQLNVQGPKSRELLQSLTSVDLSNEAFPFRTVRDIDIGIARMTCVRITYVGELGYELNIPASQATYVYDRLVEAGEKFGLKHAGLKSLASLRLEKAYRDFGHDIDNTDDPYEVGLGFAVNLKTETDFIGKAACIEKKAAAPYEQRLVQIFVEDPQPMLYHAEIVYRNGKAVGDVRAGSYGHTLGGAVGLAFLTPGETINKAYLAEGDWEVDIAGTRYPARVSFQPMYDPKNERIMA
jgi:heterotetrameric sarcosine oxidase gamma subunit